MWPVLCRPLTFQIAPLLMACAAFSAPVAALTSITSAKDLLAANRAAVGDDGKRGTFDMRFAYSGQGLTGVTSSVSDRASGVYVDRYDIDPMRGASGYDGRMPWMQDISGAYTPQDGGDRLAVAVNEAYRNANLWWRADRGGAAIDFKGRETIDGVAAYRLVVTPRGGKAFDAWFDATTILLIRVDEQQQFLTITTRYRDFARQHGMTVAHTVTVDSGTGPAGLQTMKLTRLDIGPARPLSAYSRPVEVPTGAAIDGGAVETTVPIRLANNHIYVDAMVNGKGPFPFIVDTGGHTILTPATVAALGLESQGSAPSAGAGEKIETNGYAKVREIAVGGMRMYDQTAFTLDFASRETEGFEVGGMIGFEFFRRFAVRIDYGAGTMTIIDPAGFDPKDAGTPIHFLFYDHVPQVEGRFGDLPGRFAIDTGSRTEVEPDHALRRARAPARHLSRRRACRRRLGRRRAGQIARRARQGTDAGHGDGCQSCSELVDGEGGFIQRRELRRQRRQRLPQALRRHVRLCAPDDVLEADRTAARRCRDVRQVRDVDQSRRARFHDCRRCRRRCGE